MSFPRCGIGLLLLVLLTLPAASNAGPLRSADPTPPGPHVYERIGSTNYVGPTCTLGEDGPNTPTSLWRNGDLIIPPSDRFYVLVRPDMCVECAGNNRARVVSASLTLHFRKTCTVPITAGLFAAQGPDTCFSPNENVQLCGQQLANLSGNEGETKTFEIMMADSCEFGDRAFVGFNFFTDGVDCASDTTRPELVFVDRGFENCPLCNAWNIFVKPPNSDLCFDERIGLPRMWANVSSCFTHTLPQSWGEVKAIYRRPR